MMLCTIGPFLVYENRDVAHIRTPDVRVPVPGEMWETIFSSTYGLLHIRKFQKLMEIRDGDPFKYNGPCSHLYKSVEYVSRQPSFPKLLRFGDQVSYCLCLLWPLSYRF